MMGCVEGGTHGIYTADSCQNQNLAVVGEILEWLAVPKPWSLANIGVATFQSTDGYVLGLSKEKN